MAFFSPPICLFRLQLVPVAMSKEAEIEDYADSKSNSKEEEEEDSFERRKERKSDASIDEERATIVDKVWKSCMVHEMESNILTLEKEKVAILI